ncbi:MAG: threonine/serine exporter family protein, partial [Gemmatimonadales bacterium]|nr:threonine/serine exporter family protein [Gemmatimonadales bacterium]
MSSASMQAPYFSRLEPMMHSEFDPRTDAVGFILRLARALHTYGYAAPQLEEVVSLAALRLGLVGEFSSSPTSVFAAFGEREQQRTYMLRVEPGDV